MQISTFHLVPASALVNTEQIKSLFRSIVHKRSKGRPFRLQYFSKTEMSPMETGVTSGTLVFNEG
jgi:hypothetical protein